MVEQFLFQMYFNSRNTFSPNNMTQKINLKNEVKKKEEILSKTRHRCIIQLVWQRSGSSVFGCLRRCLPHHCIHTPPKPLSDGRSSGEARSGNVRGNPYWAQRHMPTHTHIYTYSTHTHTDVRQSPAVPPLTLSFQKQGTLAHPR